jgi:Asp-tRNA(Asn)/Glu-tRNA(Gln) amidotransferase A subunit family amidase
MGEFMGELTSLSATEMAEGVRRKKFSPIELTEAHLRRIGRVNPKINAFITVDEAGALDQAKRAEFSVARGGWLGPLHGVPVTIKSSINVTGFRCETGTRLRAGTTPDEDAALVTRLRAAGAIVLGNTNAPEFLMAYETDNLIYGRTNNPWDLERTPGGSSGGESAAIAARCSAGGVGSDGGGSIRVPAHFTGICGLKPTPGRIPASGHFPPSQGPFSLIGVVGPMARTVSDVKILFEAMAGPDAGDPNSAPVPVRWPAEEELRQIRVGYFEDDGRTPVTPETRAAVRKAAEGLREQGFRVEPFRPARLEEIRQVWWKLFGPGVQVLLGPILEGRESELSPFLKEVREMANRETPLTVESLLDAQIKRDVLRERFLLEMQKFPILLCPVCSIPAFRHREREWMVEGKRVEYLDAMSYSQWFNILGNPGVVVPVGRSPEGLPIGVQVVGRPWEEEITLAVAEKVELACGDLREPEI